ncbi:DUF4936 family protein [Aromatoleum evansii]|uniref:DUF4936 family protein n=1 Tax=Aromatoleum evansii TaxID=59406 RepID=A0ABZ1AIC3_AROEV|nr:DUF4936 family protein [Aromatoleum evansii]NMG31538.1 DUF4936 family protein [Aromatoleum evansii]WRL45039.1 DUF4936 family protein [Aromatoleum evansii]
MSGDPVACVHYYVYYRVRADAEHEDAEATVRAMQAALERRTGVAGRLLERRDDAVTWMEVYEGVADPEAFEAALRIETDAHQVADLVEPGAARHTERFVECA